MGLTFTSGSTTTTASEADVFSPVTADGSHSCHIFLHNMTATEILVFKIYTYDNNTTTLRVFDTVTKSGVQSNPAFWIPPILTRQYKVTVQRTAGSDITITFDRTQQT